MNLKTVIVILFILLQTVARAQAAPSAQDAVVANGDGQITLSWKMPENSASRIGGYRIYQLRGGTELAYQVADSFLVKDVKKDTTLTVKGLKNGEQYVFILKAYDPEGKEQDATYLPGYPGSEPGKKPAVPVNVYGTEGNNQVALFWSKSTERDIAGYEVFRRCSTDDKLRLIGRFSKVVRQEYSLPGEGGKKTAAQFVSPGIARDTTVKNGDICTYLVRSVNKAGRSSDFSVPVGLKPRPAMEPTGQDVVLLVNERLPESEEIAQYYAKKRNVPAENIVRLPINRNLDKFDYVEELQKPLQNYLLAKGLAGKVTYLVPCYGVPFRSAGRAVDSKLSDLFDRYTWGRNMGTPNPFYDNAIKFDGTYGLYLVTRIDGPSAGVAKGLVDKALLAEQHQLTARSGTAYFSANFPWNETYKPIAESRMIARKAGIAEVYKSGIFKAAEIGDDALWYFSMRYSYERPKNGIWRPGALAAHLISDSFVGIKAPPKTAKSWVQELLEAGVTGTFGAVIEPYLQGYTRPDIFFERFWSGDYNFAEAFFQATPTVQWAMSAVGDPLYRLKK